jgi:hypothetical protein
VADLPSHLRARADTYLSLSLERRLVWLSDLVRVAKFRTQFHEHALALDAVLVVEHVLDMSLREVRTARETMEAANR